MTQCTECRILETKPLRADVPDHLKSFIVRDKLFGLKNITGYECRKCGSLWRWHASQSWVFIAAPKSRVIPKPATPVHAQPGGGEARPAVPRQRFPARASAALT